MNFIPNFIKNRFCKNVKIEIINLSQNKIPMPRYETVGSSGADIRASEFVKIKPGKTKLVSTGIYAKIPSNEFEIQVRTRSGLAAKHGVFVLNSPGTIDSDYTGEIKVVLTNMGDKTYTVEKGERIAQLVVSRVEKANFVHVAKKKFHDSHGRGDSGFGSTGKKW